MHPNAMLTLFAVALAYLTVATGTAVFKAPSVGALPTGDPEAIRECGNIHDIDMHKFPNTHAEFINSECAVSCTVDGRSMAPASINEGYTCPQNIHGHCHRGLCIVPNNTNHHGDPVKDCSDLNHIDMHKFNTTGTRYENGECKVLCFINGEDTGEHNINDGFTCPGNPNGSCFEGKCVPHKKPDPKDQINVDKAYADQVSFQALSGKLHDSSPMANISLCYKTVSVRTFNKADCKHYCSPTTTPCLILPTSKPFTKDSYFLFNVWQNGTSVGDAFFSIAELFQQVAIEPSLKITHSATSTIDSSLTATSTVNLYNGAPVVGEVTLQIAIIYHEVA